MARRELGLDRRKAEVKRRAGLHFMNLDRSQRRFSIRVFSVENLTKNYVTFLLTRRLSLSTLKLVGLPAG